MSRRPPPTPEELGAFLDSELDTVRASEVAADIAADPALAALASAYRADRMLIAATYGSLIDRPLPGEWLDRIADAGRLRRPRPFRWSAVAALAATILLMLSGGLTYEALRAPREEAIVVEALAARNDAMKPALDIGAGALDPGSETNRLLTRNLDMALKAPDLTRLGYSLTAMRVYEGVAGGRAVELSYRDDRQRLFTLYLRHPTSPPRVDLQNRNGVRICVWQDEFVGAVMVGEMSAGEMARVATLAYAGLNL